MGISLMKSIKSGLEPIKVTGKHLAMLLEIILGTKSLNVLLQLLEAPIESFLIS